MERHLRMWADGHELAPPREDRFVVGTDPDVDVRVHHPLVSGCHALVRRDGDGWVVQDLNSEHGTYVDGARVERHRVLALSGVDLGGPSGGLRLLLLVDTVGGAGPAPADGVATTPVAPATEPAGGPGGSVADLVRLGVVSVLVFAVALVTRRVLRAVGEEDMLEMLGFSWLAVIPKVDQALAARRPSVAGQAGVGGRPPYKTVVYLGMVVIAVLQLGGFVLSVGAIAVTDDIEVVLAFSAVGTFALLAGGFFLAGRWLARTDPDNPVAALYAGTAFGVCGSVTINLLLFTPEEWIEVYGEPLTASSIVGGFVLSGVLASIFGLWGIRRGRRRAARGSAAPAPSPVVATIDMAALEREPTAPVVPGAADRAR